MDRIIAVASNTVKQMVRMRITVVFVVLLLVLLLLLGAASTGDGTMMGRLQTFISYGLSLVGLLLSLLTILAVVHTTTADVAQCQVYTVLTKPIRRYQFILGKLLGVLAVDLLVLVIMASLVYGLTVYAPDLYRCDPQQRQQLANGFFTARKALMPQEPDVSKEVEQLYQQLVQSQEIEQVFKDVPKDQVIKYLTQQRRLAKRAAGVGQDLIWEFHKVKIADPNSSLFVRFKYNVSSNLMDLQVSSQWMVGDLRQLKEAAQVGTPIFRTSRRDPARTAREFEVPASVVAKDGYLAVAFLNDLDNGSAVVIFPLEDGLEVLYKAGGFAANFIRAILLIVVRLVFLAAVGAFAGSFLSFPVAVLLCLIVLVTGTASGFILESFTYLGENLSLVYNYTLKLLVQAIPRFDQMNPTKYLVAGRLVPWGLLSWDGGVILAKALVILLLGIWIFRSRELARTTV